MGYEKSKALKLAARQARVDGHFGARFASSQPSSFEEGETVRIKKSGEEGVVVSRASWGDYVLNGKEGLYFSPKNLEKVIKGRAPKLVFFVFMRVVV